MGHHDDLLSPEAMEDYFQEVYWRNIPMRGDRSHVDLPARRGSTARQARPQRGSVSAVTRMGRDSHAGLGSPSSA